MRSRLFTPKEELLMLIQSMAGSVWHARVNREKYKVRAKEQNDDKAYWLQMAREESSKYKLLLELLKEATECFRYSYPRRGK